MNDAQVNESKGKVPYWVSVDDYFCWIALYGSRAIVGPLMVNIGVEFDLYQSATWLNYEYFLYWLYSTEHSIRHNW